MADKESNKGKRDEVMERISGSSSGDANHVAWKKSVDTDENTSSPGRMSSIIRYRTLTKSFSHVFLPRLVKRNLPFNQSKNNISVQNEASHTHIWPLLLRDWFHVLLRLPTYVSISGLLCIWTLGVLFFAGIYMRVDSYNLNVDCGLAPPGEHMPWSMAFAFSLQTCTTVGYTLPGSSQAFFESNCPELQVAIFFQMTWSMMFNAFMFAFSYSVLSKCETRATQVVFSDKIVIQQVKGKVMLAARCYDVDAAYPIVEAHVRLYVMDRQAKLHVLRLNQPNDDTGGMLYLSLPAQVAHHIDHHSALSPRGMPLVTPSHGLILRSADSGTCSREEIICPVCGEGYGTYERLQNHIRYNRLIEEREKFPPEISHLGFEMPDISPITLQEVKNYMEYNISEILVVVEGIDPQLSGTFQSLQSYKYDDIAWEGEFEPCLSVKNNKFVVDLAKFHGVQMPVSPPNSRETSELLDPESMNNTGTRVVDDESYDSA